MMHVELCAEQTSAAGVLTALLKEMSAITDYRTLRDSLPRRLAGLLRCRCVLFYQRQGETLQFASGSFDDQPGWSASLLAFAHINPIHLHSDLPEAHAWRERQIIVAPTSMSAQIVVPLLYRHRCIGVLVAIRCPEQGSEQQTEQVENVATMTWTVDEVHLVEAVAGVVALVLENTRLLERDRERIHELSLLNSISSQMNSSMYDLERLRGIVVQRAREISSADLCELIEPSSPSETSPWISSELRELLFQRFGEHGSPQPLIIERPGEVSNPQTNEYLEHISTRIKTFFAIPLISNRGIARSGGSLLRGSMGIVQGTTQEQKVLGFVVGGYHRPWKLRREETVLLQVLTTQASAVLESMHLMTEVVEARNEARKLLRQVLEDQRLKELILECIPSGLITTDREGCIMTFNRAAEAILGYHPYEVLGQPLHKVLELRSTSGSRFPCSLPIAERSADTLYEVLCTGETRSGTVITGDRHRQEVVLDVELLPLSDNFGERVGMLVTFIDVTSVHHLEEEKRRLDRLASLGEMAANVAHEVRNPLASIKTSMQMLMDDLADTEQTDKPIPATIAAEQRTWIQESIAVVLKEVERLDTIVRDLLLFAKPRHVHRVTCNVAELCDRILQFIQPQCTEANIVVHRIYGEIPPIQIDMAQIEQVLLNLYMNAVQAMPDGGILTVVCHVIPGDGGRAGGEHPENVYVTSKERYERQREPRLEISVSDTGSGIPPEQLERIFQPFFTTKAHGIGLGLAITRRLVEDHGGYIHVEGHFGYGATVSVRLPLYPEPSSWSDDEMLRKREDRVR